MINAYPDPTNPYKSFTKEPVAGMPASSAAMPQAEGIKLSRPSGTKLFGLDLRAAATVGGLTAFFVLAMTGVVIALRQRMVTTPVAPTAPQSRPQAAVENVDNCTLQFTVASLTSPSPTPSASPGTTPSPSPSPTPTPSTTPQSQCNATCTATTDCSNAGHICYENRCRLATNVTSSTCATPVSPTPSPVVYVTPMPGCNEVCNSNADCSNSNHICYTTGGVNRCRLASYPTSENCNAPVTVTQTVTQQQVITPVQPTLPAELPQTGPEDWAKWVGAGAGALLLGGLLILFL
jgi:LPXTG-motif cell wall-anchored protein